MITLVSWPQAILHVDGDSFFASVEQALDPSLRGKALVTGQERGIASAISVEGKQMGITRGMPIGLIRQKYPECIIVPGNYEAYTSFASRMFAIMRRYTPAVEEYSIDEAFADISGLRRYFNGSYEDIARKMQSDIEKELDLTVSVGVSLTKSLAKLCSKFRKPHGLTCVKGKHIHILLQRTPIEKVWGFGKNISSMLRKNGCATAYDFVRKPLPFVEEYFTKKEIEIYKELRGELVYPVTTATKETYQSISKAHTFSPSTDKGLVYAQLSRNIEEATAKCRKYRLAARKLIVVLKDQQFDTQGLEARLTRPSSSPLEIMPIGRQLFERCYESSKQYRTTMCILTELIPGSNVQLSIFDNSLSIEKMDNFCKSLDKINREYGRGTAHLATSLQARGKGERELNIPTLTIDV